MGPPYSYWRGFRGIPLSPTYGGMRHGMRRDLCHGFFLIPCSDGFEGAWRWAWACELLHSLSLSPTRRDSGLSSARHRGRPSPPTVGIHHSEGTGAFLGRARRESSAIGHPYHPYRPLGWTRCHPMPDMGAEHRHGPTSSPNIQGYPAPGTGR